MQLCKRQAPEHIKPPNFREHDSKSAPRKGAVGVSPRAGDLKVLIVLAEG